MSEKVKILMVSRFYYPYYQAGGPVKSIKNFIDFHKDKIDVVLLTSKESLNCRETPLNNISYLSTLTFINRFFQYSRNMNEFRAIYINSFFNYYSFVAIILSSFSKTKTYVHPRGVLKKEQLEKKFLKKIFYIFFLKLFTSKVIFLVNEDGEESSVKKYFKKNAIKRTINYVSAPLENVSKSNKKFVFFSRISSEKGLHILLEFLNRTKLAIDLDIYGNPWDKRYFDYCMKLIEANHCSNIRYLGEINPTEVDNTLSKYRCMILPTRGENFGHVIYESLKNSVPVITSFNVPWHLNKYKCGQNINFDDSQFLQSIKYYSEISEIDYQNEKKNALAYSLKYYKDQKSFNLNQNE